MHFRRLQSIALQFGGTKFFGRSHVRAIFVPQTDEGGSGDRLQIRFAVFRINGEFGHTGRQFDDVNIFKLRVFGRSRLAVIVSKPFDERHHVFDVHVAQNVIPFRLLIRIPMDSSSETYKLYKVLKKNIL